ncbi:hypothetical protein LguiB_022246 [Lonicera macranthoides]
MVKFFSIIKPLVRGLMKLVGMTPQLVEIEPGTTIHIWVPTQTINKTTPKTFHKPNKPVVVLIHGFALNGILTWLFQVLNLSKNYSVYVPDLIFFGGSVTDKADRSTGFQADCFAKTLRKLGVDKCIVVGFSYGGMVGYKMASLHPELVESLVLSSTVIELTKSISDASLKSIGFSCWKDFLLPESVEGVKTLLSIGSYKFPWIPDFVFEDFLKVMLKNRKERGELLEASVIKDNEASSLDHPQIIYMLWGEDEKIFNLKLAQTMKEQLGDKASLQYIKKAGHLVQVEQPALYNQHLNKILSLKAQGQ